MPFGRRRFAGCDKERAAGQPPVVCGATRNKEHVTRRLWHGPQHERRERTLVQCLWRMANQDRSGLPVPGSTAGGPAEGLQARGRQPGATSLCSTA